jgi:geranylgeranyl pyrophosphate synthase
MTPDELKFIQKLIVDSKTQSTYWKAWNDSKTTKRVLKLLAKYGKNKVYKTIDLLKKHEAMHKATRYGEGK